MPMPTAYAHGAAMLLPRSVIDQVGLMNEDFFLYYEELDWCERIRKAGYEVWVEPRVRIYHKESATVQKLGALKTYYLNRNRVWFMRKHHKGLSLLLFYLFLFCFTIPKNSLLYLIKGERKNLAAFLKGVFWNFR
jgi:GT2 family glycosyltransferase